MTSESMIAEMVLMRYVTRCVFVTEEQMAELTRIKQRLMVGFAPADRELGYRWFNKQFRQAADAVAGITRET